MAGDGFISRLPDDAFVHVLLLLPTSSQRRFRLVCKRWRGLIDERTPERQAPTKILAFFAETCGSRAFVFDGDDGCRMRHAWTYPCSYDISYDLVGTCNGLLCLHERSALSINAGSQSAISVTNPITGETQLLPPAPTYTHWEKVKALGKYSFGYHPTTGKYKVVHIPPQGEAAAGAVWVFTLGGGGGASWREVPVTIPGGASYHHSCEAVSVDGSTYWLNASTDRVVALDLEDEPVTWLHVPPSVVVRRCLTPDEGGWQLTSVHARLGIARTTALGGVDLWVLEKGGGGGRPRWARRCTLPEPGGHLGLWNMAPHLTYGEYAMTRLCYRDLTHGEYDMTRLCYRARLYRHKVGSLIGRHGNNGLPPLLEGAAELVMDDDTPYYKEMKTFAYVETLEPLPAMNGPAAGDGGSNQTRAENGGMEKNVRG